MRWLPDDRCRMVANACGEANSAAVNPAQASRAGCRLDGPLASRFLLMRNGGMPMNNALRGADIVARSLERLGCPHVFTLSGNHIMSVFDAALETKLDLVHVRHEAAAVHMADAWGRLTGKPGVALVTGRSEEHTPELQSRFGI